MVLSPAVNFKKCLKTAEQWGIQTLTAAGPVIRWYEKGDGTTGGRAGFGEGKPASFKSVAALSFIPFAIKCWCISWKSCFSLKWMRVWAITLAWKKNKDCNEILFLKYLPKNLCQNIVLLPCECLPKKSQTHFQKVWPFQRHVPIILEHIFES